ncbi:ATP-binding protein [Streptomyces sp. 150FB]|uniref:ATP-binding protein n=1 Tax=Streptomyces sp. 150FB TaxID=1576605 RepID=UPI000589483E|nr:ATP-binding protein [Streptomyces sp. 150FB]KIF75795.1 ATP-binding protein [Streptomyces sp. 150FB]
MIIWLNGAFGAGKTTTTEELTALLPESRAFAAEQVGYMLRHVLHTVPVRDFQEWPPWRALVVETASRILGFVGGTLVVPQTVLVRRYWREIDTGLWERGIPVHHFVLHTDRDTLTTRIHTDTKPESRAAVGRRLGKLSAYEDALPWLRQEAAIIDTTEITPAQAAHQIAERTQ